jgi:hypothetical protein
MCELTRLRTEKSRRCYRVPFVMHRSLRVPWTYTIVCPLVRLVVALRAVEELADDVHLADVAGNFFDHMNEHPS